MHGSMLSNPHLQILSELAEKISYCAASLAPGAQQDARTFIAAAVKQGRLTHYKVFPPAAQLLLDRQVVGTRDSAQAALDPRQQFLRLCILVAAEQTLQRRSSSPLPPLLHSQQTAQLARIASEKDLAGSWLNLAADLFHKEFGLASERLFAAGAQLVDPNCGVPRSVPFREGFWRSLPKIVPFLRLGGFSPWFQIHTHRFNLENFDERGWETCYRGCQELYQVFPDSLGMFGSSWFYDPVVPEISPRLAYLRDTPLAGGASIHYYSTGGEAIANATATSPSRRKLHEEGKYIPKNYILLWPRAKQ